METLYIELIIFIHFKWPHFTAFHTFPPYFLGAQGAQVGDDRPRGSHGRLHGASHAAARHLQEIPEIYGGFHKWGIPLNGWFIMKNPIN